MTFCSIKLQICWFCCVRACARVCVLPEVRCREGTSPSIPELSAALSAMDFRLLRGSGG